MRVFAAATALSILLAAAPTFAQAPAQTAPRPAAPAAQTPAPQTSAPQPAAQPNVPFPSGVKYAYVNLEAVFADSAEGQRVQKLIQTKQTELQGKQKAFQDAQQKAQQSASVMSDVIAPGWAKGLSKSAQLPSGRCLLCK